MRLLGVFGVFLLLGGCGSAYAQESIFAKSGRMVPVGKASQLSLYCSGRGAPTIILEAGFGGGTAATWYKLQPELSKLTRTCSYDRAGYGFSTLGSNVPRDLDHAVADLGILLKQSGEQPPYILVGHSNGGLMIGAFADRQPEHVGGLVFLDAAVVLPDDAPANSTQEQPALDGFLGRHLAQIRRCLARAEKTLIASAGDECVDPNWYSSLPPDLARAEVANRSKADFWRAYLSEAENNYSGKLSGQARALLPHRWPRVPVRIFIASVAAMDEEAASKAFGIAVTDGEALAQARANRAAGERRQERVCEWSTDCSVTHVPTANHLVHNEALAQVVAAVEGIVKGLRQR
jgi:pimeloyl-ACP methyl ester carboxylesterase